MEISHSEAAGAPSLSANVLLVPQIMAEDGDREGDGDASRPSKTTPIRINTAVNSLVYTCRLPTTSEQAAQTAGANLARPCKRACAAEVDACVRAASQQTRPQKQAVKSKTEEPSRFQLQHFI